jgi:hypothetical protein
MALELDLLLRTGRARDVLEWTSPEVSGALGEGSYHFLRAQAAAALGDYALAEEECAQLATRGQGPEAVAQRNLMALLIGQTVLDEYPGARPAGCLPWRAYRQAEFRSRLSTLVWNMKQEANAHVLWGLVALEAGESGQAESAFRRALGVWKDEAAAASGAGVDFNARPVAQGALSWLAEANRKEMR